MLSAFSRAQINIENVRQKTAKKWYHFSIEEVFHKVSSRRNGLSAVEAAERLIRFGPNKLPSGRPVSSLNLFFKQFKSALVYILICASLISLFLGDHLDAFIIFLAVLINVVLGFYQEKKAQNSLRALRETIVSYCQVLRDNRRKQIIAEEIVPGDIVFLSPGDQVPADLRLIASNNLKINEAALTGESESVEKTPRPLSGDLILADQRNMLFMGTQVSEGTGSGLVVASGSETYLGYIAALVAEGDNQATPLQRKLAYFSRRLSLIILGACVSLFALGIAKGYSFSIIFATAVAVAVSAIPEGLLVVVTMTLALGMRRILESQALAKHLLTAETLGSTSVICVDKTGTLTEGEMRVAEVTGLDYNISFSSAVSGKNRAFGEELLLILSIGAVCNNAYSENPDSELERGVIRGSPTEKALLMAADSVGLNKADIDRESPRLDEMPFDSKWKYMMTLNGDGEGRSKIYLKGAPEEVLNFCAYCYSAKKQERKVELDHYHRGKIMSLYENMSRRGLRVIALGYKNAGAAVRSLSGVEKKDFIFAGLVGIKDPVRKEVAQVIAQAGKSGIKTIMITGDHQFTAAAVAAEVGLPHQAKNIITGASLRLMSESDLVHSAADFFVYARVTPEDKLKIVKAWQARNEVVAMTGDGINDAPALKRADVGIAVGSGTDVAKETADLILLDNNFKNIISAVREGRVIFDNIRKVVLYLLSNSFAEILIVAVSLIIGWPVPLLPIQIIWINLVSDTFPALALTREPADTDIMQRQPYRLNEQILNRQARYLSGIISLVSALFTLIIFRYFYRSGGGLDYARTVSFTFLALSTLIYIFSIRNTRRPLRQINLFSNHYLLMGVLFSFLLQLAAIYQPFLQKFFSTVPLNIGDWLVIILACFLVLSIIEAFKSFFLCPGRRSSIKE